MIGDIFGNELQTTTFKIELQSKRHINRQHEVRVIGYIGKISEDLLIG